MRYVATRVIGLILLGLVTTAVLADQTILGSGFNSDQKIVAMMRVEDVGKLKNRWEGSGISAEVGYVDDGRGGCFFGGVMTQTQTPRRPDDQHGTQGQVVTNTIRLDFPMTGIGRRANKVSLKSGGEEWGEFLWPLEEFVNALHGTGPGEVMEWSKTQPEVGGHVTVTEARSSGKIKTDRKTFAKYKGKLVIKYLGTVSDGPNAGKAVKGKVKILMKRGVAEGF